MAKRPPVSMPVSETTAIQEPPVSLDDCYALALKQSEALAIKGITVEESWADYLRASSEALGDVSFVNTDFLQDPQKGGAGSSDVGSSFSREERRERKLTISQPIFQGFKSLGAIAGAGSVRKERIYDYDRDRETLFLDLAMAFYLVIMNEKEFQIQKDTLQSLEERIHELKDRENIGKSRLSEVVTAESRAQALRAALMSTEGTIRNQRRLLEFLTGVTMNERDLVDTNPLSQTPDHLEEYIKDAAERHDVLASEQSEKTALQGLVVAQSKLWPNVTLDANSYDKREGFQSGISWDLLFTVKIPLFQGGGAVGEVKSAYADYKRAKVNHQLTKRRAELEIKQAYESFISSQKQFGALEESVRTAQQNYDLQRQDYSLNLVNNLDVLAALQALNESRQEANRLFYKLKQDYWRLQIARGKCCEPA